MSTKSLCHFCMGEWMPAWRLNSQTVLIFAHRLIFFFLLPCRHQRLQQLDKLPGYCSLHLGKKPLPKISSLTEKVLWWSTVLLLSCSWEFGLSCSTHSFFQYLLSLVLVSWSTKNFILTALEQWCVTSYSTERLTLMLIGHYLYPL